MGKCIYLRKGETHTKPVSTIYAASLNIGDVVKLNEGGVMTEFIVVNQGLPDGSLYDISCNGTWLLRKDIKENRVWNSSTSNTYATSTVNTWLNGDYFNSLGTIEQELVKQVKIPYVNGDGVSGTIATGANGFSTKIFFCSGTELGISGNALRVEGAKLSYFVAGTSGNTGRVAYLSGTASAWWTRSPSNDARNDALSINTSGLGSFSITVASASGIRPCLILPFTAKFNSETKVLVGGG